VSFNLKHKFTQVRVKISVSKITGATITDIGTVTIENQNTVDLTVQDGALSNYTNVGALDVSSSLDTEDDVIYLSDYYVFHPSPTRVNISSIEVTESGVPKTYTNLYTTFTQGLAAEGSYTLAVDFTKYPSGMFAGSNIYWNEEELTFDKIPRGSDSSSSQYYAGVYFKWGSLVGISRDEYLFIPNTSTETWEGPEAIGNSEWGSYPSIPYNAPSSSGYDNYKGDICNYIDEAWHTPTETELGSLAGISLWSKGSHISAYTNGTGIITTGGTYAYSHGVVFFPAAGYYFGGPPLRDELLAVNNWSSSGGYTYGYVGSYLAHTDGSPSFVGTNILRANALSVRCIKN
jgi:hypothetical protein